MRRRKKAVSSSEGEEVVRKRGRPPKQDVTSAEEIDDICPVCEEICTCGQNGKRKKRQTVESPTVRGRPLSKVKKVKGKATSSSRSISRNRSRRYSIISEIVSEVEDELSKVASLRSAENVLSEIALMEDPTEAINLLWSTEEESSEEQKSSSSSSEQSGEEEVEQLFTEKVETNETKTSTEKVAPSSTPAPTQPSPKSILQGMSREKLVAQLNNLPPHVLATLGAAARREMAVKKPETLKTLPNRALTRQESIQLITELLSPPSGKKQVPQATNAHILHSNLVTAKKVEMVQRQVINNNVNNAMYQKKKPSSMTKLNIMQGTLPRGTKLSTSQQNDTELRISIEKAMYELSSDESSDDEVPENYEKLARVFTVDGGDEANGSSEDPQATNQWAKIPIGTFRRSRRLSQPFIMLSKAIKSSVLHSANARSSSTSIHSLLSPSICTPFSNTSPLLTPTQSKLLHVPEGELLELPSRCATPELEIDRPIFLDLNDDLFFE
jgi:hypothetical protein